MQTYNVLFTIYQKRTIFKNLVKSDMKKSAVENKIY